MLNRIIDFSVKNKLIIGLLIIALIGYGGYQFTKLPIDAVPDITNNQVQVITIAPSLGATDIERLITFPIEMANSNISGLHEIRSFSRFGLSLVTIVFDDDIDIYWARQQVSERIQNVQTSIPRGIADISLGPITTGLGEIYQYTLRAAPGYENKYDAIALRSIQDWIVRRQLLGAKGVAEVSSFGGKLKQYEISIEPTKLKSYNLSIEDVFEALEKNNQNTGGAYIEKGPIALYIRSEGLIGNIDDIQTICIKNNSNGTPLLLRDIAEINIGFATRYGALCYNDEGEVSGAVVMMLKGENSSRVIDNIKQRISQIQKTLPKGVILEPYLDRTKMVNNAIGTVKTNLLEGALIVLFVLVLFLGNFRAGLLVASVIPLSMLIAVIMMNFFKVSGNLMSLGALDFGLIIDGAVIIVEAVLHSLHFNKKNSHSLIEKNNNMDAEVKNTASRMMNNAVFGQIIILIVYLPIFFLSGIEGKMFKPMVQTVVFALIGAFILSITYIPMMSAMFLGNKKIQTQNFSDKMMRYFEKYYQYFLFKALQIPRIIIALILMLFMGSIVVLSNLGGEFIPTLEEGDFAVEFRVLPGSNLNTTIERSQKAAHILKSKFPEVLQVVTKIGSGEIPNDPMPMEAADMMVILKDKGEWVSAKTFSELAEKMSDALGDLTGITASFQYPVQMRFNELMTGAKQDVVCKIFGENLDTLTYYAQKLGGISNGIEGAQDIFVETVVGLPEIIIKYNRASIAQYGLNINEINNVVNTALAGQSAGKVYEGEQHYSLVVRLKNSKRNNIEAVKDLLIRTNKGTQVPLTQLATIEIKEGPNQIQREDTKRRIIVGFNTRGRDVESIVNELQEKVNKKIKLPSGYYITYGGSFENLNAAKARMGITVPISLVLIFLFLFFAFGSIKHSLLIYTAIPLSAIGGVFALALRDMPFSISAGIGFIALFGVAVLNGIVLIAEFNQLKSSGLNDIKTIIFEGTKTRLRPILMTAFVASLGFLPMATSNGAGAEVQRPLATVVIGGLLIATFLTLFVLPILYLWFEKGFYKKGSNGPIKTLLIIIGIIVTCPSHAQVPISLKASIDTAIANNLLLKSERLNVDYYKQLQKAAWNIDQTNISAEYGQVNSIYTDSKFGIHQNIKFPTYYAKQKDLFKGEWEKSNYNFEYKKCELKKEVSQIFYHINYLQQLKKILSEADSIFNIYAQNALNKFEKGESNLIEKNTATWQHLQLRFQLEQIEIDYEKLILDYNLLLHGKILFMPEDTPLLSLNIIEENKSFEKHPSVLIFKQQQFNTALKIQLEKSQLLPSLQLGYNNMSIRGIGADDINYSSGKRFQSLYAGFGIPLFFGAQKAKIKAEKLQLLQAENEYYHKSIFLENEYKKAIQQYQNCMKKVAYFQKEINQIGAEMLINTMQQYSSGSINYLEWAMLQNQILGIKTEYLNAVKELNFSIIEINYLNNKQ
jgi:cobalt-zinc-cadmium resistance protein CzcA